jgi:hypothetical protein
MIVQGGLGNGRVLHLDFCKTDVCLTFRSRFIVLPAVVLRYDSFLCMRLNGPSFESV